MAGRQLLGSDAVPLNAFGHYYLTAKDMDTGLSMQRMQYFFKCTDICTSPLHLMLNFNSVPLTIILSKVLYYTKINLLH